MVWSLALCRDDTKQDSVVYGAKFGVVFLAKGPRTIYCIIIIITIIIIVILII